MVTKKLDGTINLLFVALYLMAVVWPLPAQAQESSDSLLEGKIFSLDRTHSLLDFTARHIGFGRVRGTFKNYDAAVYFVENDILRSTVSVWAEVGSIDTSSPGRDGQLRKEFFEVEQYPLIRFHSERVERDGDGFTLIGPLTIRDVTREVKIPFRVATPKSVDQFRHTRITFTGGFTINRKDYGVIYTDSPFWDGIASDDIRIEIDLSVRIFNYLDSVFPKWRSENSIGKLAMQIVEEKGVAAARQQVKKLWLESQEDYDFQISQLYRTGMMLFQKGQFRDAIGILEVAAEIYRDSAEDDDVAAIFTILGEAHARTGDRAKAVLFLTKALSLDPRNLRAAELVRQLKN